MVIGRSASPVRPNKVCLLRRKGVSFTDVILRLCSEAAKKPLVSFAGPWIISDDGEAEIFGEISELWRRYEESLLRGEC